MTSIPKGDWKVGRLREFSIVHQSRGRRWSKSPKLCKHHKWEPPKCNRRVGGDFRKALPKWIERESLHSLRGMSLDFQVASIHPVKTHPHYLQLATLLSAFASVILDRLDQGGWKNTAFEVTKTNFYGLIVRPK